MIKKIFVAGLMAIGLQAMAGELDQSVARPSALVVREDAQGNKDVFKVDLAAKVATDVDAVSALNLLSTDAKVSVQKGSELDQATSQEAWCSWPNYGYNYGYGYSNYYSYNYYSYSYYYYPTYSYNWGAYRYSYYWCY